MIIKFPFKSLVHFFVFVTVTVILILIISLIIFSLKDDPINCEGSWSNFGECSVECGGGKQTRTYSITTEPQYGGTPCPTSPESRSCNTAACATCSSFQCPRDYNPRSEAVNESCGKTRCDSSNIDLCCENIRGDNDATEGDNDAAGDGDTGVVDVPNATCSTVSGNCPYRYLYKTDSAEKECNGPTCDVGIGGVDLNTCCLKWNCTNPFTHVNPPVGYVINENLDSVTFSARRVSGVRCDTENGYYVPFPNIITATCGDDIDGQPPSYTLSGCEQGCSAPSSLPTGYTGSLPATLPVSGGDISGVNCDTNYHGTPTYNCAIAGEGYTLNGCDPDICTTPDTTGYSVVVTSLEKHNFNVNVSCEAGYGPSASDASARASQCSNHNSPYSLTGCEHKTGFCSGNYDSSHDFDCPTGYNDKPDKNTTVSRTITDCCNPWICGISDDDFALYDIQVEGGSININQIPYSTIDSATVSCKAGAQRTSGSVTPSIQSCINDGDNVTLNGCEHAPVDCVVDWSEWSDCSAECGGGTQTRTYTITTQPQYGGIPCLTTPESQPCNIEACATCSSYQCPTGYNDKPNKNTIIGNTLETCCDQIITPEAQASESQGTELPICEDIKLADQVPDARSNELLLNKTLEECMIHCRDNDNCNSFSYKDQRLKCYIYNQSNIEHHRDAHYDYYPEKCRPRN